MATIPTNVEGNLGAGDDKGQFVRVILADTQAIFRAGLRKVFALEDDIRVVGQAETLPQTQSAVAKFSADVLIFRSSPDSESGRIDCGDSSPESEVASNRGHTWRGRGVDVRAVPPRGHGIVSREVEPELLVECLRTVVAGETWLDKQGVSWVMQAYRSQNNRTTGARPKVQLTPKETLIVSCVTQGMKNKEIALRVGTTEQVVKNYLRKVYDKLGVADRLELALYCLNHHVVDNTKVPPAPVPAATVAIAAAAGASASGSAVPSPSSSTPDDGEKLS